MQGCLLTLFASPECSFFQVQCDAYTCAIKIMGSAAYIVNQQAKRLEIRDDGRRPRTVVFCFQFTKRLDLI